MEINMKTFYVPLAAAAVLMSSFLQADTRLTFSLPTGDRFPDVREESVNLGRFGDPVFAELRSTELDVENQIRDALNRESIVERVNFVNADFSDVDALLTGDGGGVVTASVGRLKLSASARIDEGIPILCPSVRARIDLENIVITASYNYFTGALVNLDASYDPDVDISCGTLGDLLGIPSLARLFFDEDAFVENSIEDAIMDFGQMENFQNLFGVMEILDDPNVSGAVSLIESRTNFDVSDFLNELLAGLNLRVGLFSDRFGSNENQILISGFQSPANFTFDASGSISTVSSRSGISFSAPGADRFKLYIDRRFIGEFRSGSHTILNTSITPSSRFDVLTENSIFSVPSFNQSYTLELVCPTSSGTRGRCFYTEKSD